MNWYRRNASAVVLRPVLEGYQVLLLKKPRPVDTWQLPQGGIEDGETVEQAAMRELEEETRIVDGTLLGRLDVIYQYEYPKGFSRFPEYRGQQLAFVAVNVSPSKGVIVDGKEVVDYRWLDADEIPFYVRRPEYLRVVRQAMREAGNLIQSSSHP